MTFDLSCVRLRPQGLLELRGRPVVAGSADAISEHVLLLLPQLRLLYSQRKEVRDRIEALLNGMTILGRERPDSREHRDVGLLLSMPGLGSLIAANLFSEGADLSPKGITMPSVPTAGSRP